MKFLKKKTQNEIYNILSFFKKETEKKLKLIENKMEQAENIIEYQSRITRIDSIIKIIK